MAHKVPGRIRRRMYLVLIPPRRSPHGLSQPSKMLSPGTWLFRYKLAATLSKMSARRRSNLPAKLGTIGTTHTLSTHFRTRLKTLQGNKKSSMSFSGSGPSTSPALTMAVTGTARCRLRGYHSFDIHMTQLRPTSTLYASSVSRLTQRRVATIRATPALQQDYNGRRTRVVRSISRMF